MWEYTRPERIRHITIDNGQGMFVKHLSPAYLQNSWKFVSLTLFSIEFRTYVKILKIQIFLYGRHFEFYSLIWKNKYMEHN